MDKELYEEKLKFVETQREKIRQDLEETQSKFAIALEKLYQIREQDKVDNEESQNALLKAVERRYQQRIDELENYNNRKMVQLEEQIQDKNLEIKQLRMLYQQQSQKACEKCECGCQSKGLDGLQKEQFMNYQKLKESYENETKLLQDKLKNLECKCQELENFRTSAKKIFEETQLSQAMQPHDSRLNSVNCTVTVNCNTSSINSSINYNTNNGGSNASNAGSNKENETQRAAKQPYFHLDDGKSRSRRSTFITPSRVDILRSSHNQLYKREKTEHSLSTSKSKSIKKELNFTCAAEKVTSSKARK